MRNMKLLCSLLLLAVVFSSGNALADRRHGGHGHGRGNVGIYFGLPYAQPFYPSPYYYPYPYYPQPLFLPAPAQPTEYIEQQDEQADSQQPAPAAEEAYYWYYCDNPEGYYPYVKECTGEWQKVSPTPPAQP